MTFTSDSAAVRRSACYARLQRVAVMQARDPKFQLLRCIAAEHIHVVILTGDSRTTAAARRMSPKCCPDQKAATVKRFQADGRSVGMAGDGADDAPVLAQAQVSTVIAEAAMF